MDPAPREDARGSRWARAGVLGVGLVLAGGALLAARGWEEPAAAGESRAQSSEPGPASMGTPLVIDTGAAPVRYGAHAPPEQSKLTHCPSLPQVPPSRSAHCPAPLHASPSEQSP